MHIPTLFAVVLLNLVMCMNDFASQISLVERKANEYLRKASLLDFEITEEDLSDDDRDILALRSYMQPQQQKTTEERSSQERSSKEAKEKEAQSKAVEPLACTTEVLALSVAKMRTLIEQNFTGDNRLKCLSNPFTKHPVLQWTDLEKIFKKYLEMFEDKRGDNSSFVEKNYIAMEQVLVIGDIHGAGFSLQALFDDWISKGFMHDDYTLAAGFHVVFLGDYVDRGEAGIEVLAQLLYLKIKNPAQVTLIRGNHEDLDINSQYGFVDELEAKYTPDVCKALHSALALVYETFPTALFLGAGESCTKEKLSYMVFVHGMIDEVLAKSTAEILKDISAQKVLFKNSAQGCYVSGYNMTKKTSQVAWGDLAQWCDHTQVLSEPATRMMPLMYGEPSGRPVVNIKWIEENFFNRYPSIQMLFRGHQHWVGAGVVFDTKTWNDVLKSASRFPVLYNALFSGPYGQQGPFLREAASELLEKMYGGKWQLGEHAVKVMTTSVANVPEIEIKGSLGYFLLTPSSSPATRWKVDFLEVLGNERQETTVSEVAAVPASTFPTTPNPSASSSSATSSSAPAS